MSISNSPITDFAGNHLSQEDAKKRVEDLHKLVLGDNILKRIRTDDAFLSRFLYSTEFEVAAAFKRIQAYYYLLLQHADWYGSVSPLEIKEQINKNDKAVLRERDRGGRAIFVLKLGQIDVINSCPAEQAAIVEIMLEAIMDDPKIQARGLSVILDMDGYSWKLFKWLSISNIRIGIKKMELYPLKELVLHIVNTSFLLNASIKLLWPFLSDNIKNRVKFHYDDWSSLHEYISPDVLPSEYDGTGSDLDFEKLNQIVFDQSEEIGAKLKYQDALKIN